MSKTLNGAILEARTTSEQQQLIAAGGALLSLTIFATIFGLAWVILNALIIVYNKRVSNSTTPPHP